MITIARQAADFELRSSIFNLTTSDQPLLRPDSSRVALIWQCQVNPPGYIDINPFAVIGNQGIVLFGNVNPIPMLFRDFGALVCSAWHGISPGAATISVMEIFYRPGANPEVMGGGEPWGLNHPLRAEPTNTVLAETLRSMRPRERGLSDLLPTGGLSRS